MLFLCHLLLLCWEVLPLLLHTTLASTLSSLGPPEIGVGVLLYSCLADNICDSILGFIPTIATPFPQLYSCHAILKSGNKEA